MKARSALSTLSKNRAAIFGRAGAVPTHRAARYVHVEKRLEELDITLPPPGGPKANYDMICHAQGNMLYISGHLPINQEGVLTTGKIGPEADGGKSVEHGYDAARQAGLAIVATLQKQLGDLDRVDQIVKVGTKMEFLVLMIWFMVRFTKL